ncbi:MAG: hypothetical protein AAGF85_13375 [Bacteroidota bacterium]
MGSVNSRAKERCANDSDEYFSCSQQDVYVSKTRNGSAQGSVKPGEVYYVHVFTTSAPVGCILPNSGYTILSACNDLTINTFSYLGRIQINQGNCSGIDLNVQTDCESPYNTGEGDIYTENIPGFVWPLGCPS